MGLKPEVSLPVGLAVGALVWGIYSNGLPPVVDIRSSPQNHPDVASTEKAAAWTSAAVVAGVSLIAKDPTVFIIGGSMVIALSWWHRHANTVNPEWSMAVPQAASEAEMGYDDVAQESGGGESYDAYAA